MFSLQEDFDNWRRTLWEPICKSFGVEFKQTATSLVPTYILTEVSNDVKHSNMVTWNTKGINRK